MGDMGDGWGWWMLFGTVMMFGSVAAIVWAVTARDRRPLERGEQQEPRAEPTAREILERRYASGELTHDEFEEMRRRLTS